MVSRVSYVDTLNDSWCIIGPWSRSSVTKWAVHPIILAPRSYACNICVRTRKSRKKRWMNIDNSVWIAPYKVWSQYVHIPREDYQVYVILLYQLQDSVFSLFMICMNYRVKWYAAYCPRLTWECGRYQWWLRCWLVSALFSLHPVGG